MTPEETRKKIKDNFSEEEIKLLIEIVWGRLEFEVLETAIKDFYSDAYINPNERLIDKLEFDLEMGGMI